MNWKTIPKNWAKIAFLHLDFQILFGFISLTFQNSEIMVKTFVNRV
jgi:hypothetical protein